MIEADAGDDGNQRAADVGGVEPTAQAHFQDGDVDVRAGEVEQGGCGEDLEEGRPDLVAAAGGCPGVHCLDGRLNFRQDAQKRFRAGRAVHRPRACSSTRSRWGEVNSPVRYRAADSMAATAAEVEPFPFVPATWTAGRLRCGLPSRAKRRLMRPSRSSATP